MTTRTLSLSPYKTHYNTRKMKKDEKAIGIRPHSLERVLYRIHKKCCSTTFCIPSTKTRFNYVRHQAHTACATSAARPETTPHRQNLSMVGGGAVSTLIVLNLLHTRDYVVGGGFFSWWLSSLDVLNLPHTALSNFMKGLPTVDLARKERPIPWSPPNSKTIDGSRKTHSTLHTLHVHRRHTRTTWQPNRLRQDCSPRLERRERWDTSATGTSPRAKRDRTPNGEDSSPSTQHQDWEVITCAQDKQTT